MRHNKINTRGLVRLEAKLSTEPAQVAPPEPVPKAKKPVKTKKKTAKKTKTKKKAKK